MAAFIKFPVPQIGSTITEGDGNDSLMNEASRTAKTYGVENHRIRFFLLQTYQTI